MAVFDQTQPLFIAYRGIRPNLNQGTSAWLDFEAEYSRQNH